MLNLSTSGKIAILRFLGYISVQFNAVLVPLLVFKMTNSLAMAGLTTILEWVPKMFFYLFGGSFIQKISSLTAHKLCELTRIACFLLFLVCTLNSSVSILIGITAALFQAANAISNIIFETLITENMDQAERPYGHALMLKADQIACFIALLVALIPMSIGVLCIVGVLSQILTFNFLLKYKNIHGDSLSKHEKTKNAFPYRKLFSNKSFFLLCLGLAGFSFPIAYISVVLPFMLGTEGANIQSIFVQTLLIKTALTIGCLYLIKNSLKVAPSNNLNIFRGGALLLVLSLLCLTFTQSKLFIIVFFVLISLSSIFVTPYLRTLRQEFIVKNDLIAHLHFTTGLFIGIDTLSYIMAGTVVASHQNIIHGLWLSLFVFSFSWWFLYLYSKSIKSK